MPLFQFLLIYLYSTDTFHFLFVDEIFSQISRQTKKAASLQLLFSLKKPATSYSPRQSPTKYHRPPVPSLPCSGWERVFLTGVSSPVSSPSWARTNNPPVNSRMLYHWAIEDQSSFCFLKSFRTPLLPEPSKSHISSEIFFLPTSFQLPSIFLRLPRSLVSRFHFSFLFLIKPSTY